MLSVWSYLGGCPKPSTIEVSEEEENIACEFIATCIFHTYPVLPFAERKIAKCKLKGQQHDYKKR